MARIQSSVDIWESIVLIGMYRIKVGEEGVDLFLKRGYVSIHLAEFSVNPC